jgi:hypothetical protein
MSGTDTGQCVQNDVTIQHALMVMHGAVRCYSVAVRGRKDTCASVVSDSANRCAYDEVRIRQACCVQSARHGVFRYVLRPQDCVTGGEHQQGACVLQHARLVMFQVSGLGKIWPRACGPSSPHRAFENVLALRLLACTYAGDTFNQLPATWSRCSVGMAMTRRRSAAHATRRRTAVHAASALHTTTACMPLCLCLSVRASHT